MADCSAGNWFWVTWEPTGLVTLGQGQTVGVDYLMVFHDDSPITINHVGFTSLAAVNDEWLVPDEFVSGPGKFSLVIDQLSHCSVSAK